MKGYWGSGGIAPRILDLGTRWKWVVSFTPRPLYPQGRSPWYPFHRRLGGPQSRSGKVKGKLSLCLTKHHATKAYWESEGLAPLILDLGTRWNWVVSFTPQPLYPKEKSTWYPLVRRLGGSQSRSGRGGEEKNSQPPPGRDDKEKSSHPLPGIDPPIIQPVAQR
jgi:hypothetical protein